MCVLPKKRYDRGAWHVGRLLQITCSKCIKFNNYLQVFSQSERERERASVAEIERMPQGEPCLPALWEIMHKYLMKNRRMLTPSGTPLLPLFCLRLWLVACVLPLGRWVWKEFLMCAITQKKNALSLSVFLYSYLSPTLFPSSLPLPLSHVHLFVVHRFMCLDFSLYFWQSSSSIACLPTACLHFPLPVQPVLPCLSCFALPPVRQQLSKLMSSIRWHLLLLLLPLLFHDKCFCLP